MFAGLVVDEGGAPAEVDYVGESACYVVDDEGFRRFIDAEEVDRQVLRFMREQVDEHRDLAIGQMLDMMGQHDIFTKAALESSINNLEEAVGQPVPNEARQYLAMLGFRIVVDVHGEVVEVAMPGTAADDDDDE